MIRLIRSESRRHRTRHPYHTSTEDDEIALCGLEPAEEEKGKTQTDKQEAGVTLRTTDSVRVNEVSQTTATVTATDENQDDAKYLNGWKLVLITIGLCLAVFILTLDNTILSTALPRLTAEFDSIADVGWYGSSYLLTTTALQPSFGKVFTFASVKWVWLGSLLIFEAGSVVCATAVNSAMFIIGRAVAGIGAAGLFSGAIAIIGKSVPLRKRPVYLGVVSIMSAIASVVGPILGGVLTDQLSWRWCFWINPIFGGVAAITIVLFYTETKRSNSTMTTKESLKQFDFAGVIILFPAVVCLVLVLQWGGVRYEWSNFRVWGCLVISLGLFLCFGVVQVIMKERATIPRRIICNRTVATGALFAMLLSMALYVHIFYLPGFYFQKVKKFTPQSSGTCFLPYLLALTVGGLVSGGLITTFGPLNPSLWSGIVMFTGGSFLLCTLTVDSTPAQYIGYQILAGVGAGTCGQVPLTSMQVVLNEHDVTVGNAIIIFATTLGGAIGVPVAQNIFGDNLGSEVLDNGGPATPALYSLAIASTFMFAVICSGLALLVSFVMPWNDVKHDRVKK